MSEGQCNLLYWTLLDYEETGGMMLRWILLLTFLVFSPAASVKAEGSLAKGLFNDSLSHTPSSALPAELPMEEAPAIREELVALLSRPWGNPIGYKAAFTSAATQERFGFKEPQWGYLFAQPLLESPAVVDISYGVFPRFETDLVVVVKQSGLAEAASPREVLSFLESIHPFVELVDMTMADPPTGPGLIASNIGQRGGVLGPAVQVEDTDDFYKRLGTMQVEAWLHREGISEKVTDSTGAALLGHPLESALWLAKALKAQGIALKPGDRLSLGGFMAPKEPEPGCTLQVFYHNLIPTSPAAIDIEFIHHP